MPSPCLHRRFRADQLAPTRARHLVRQWLGDLRWPADAADDLSVAVYEATANVVEHAYVDREPGSFELVAYPEPADRHQHHLVVSVRDDGQWQPRSPSPSRRWGTPLMAGYSDMLEIIPSDQGTLTLLVSLPVKLPIDATSSEVLGTPALSSS